MFIHYTWSVFVISRFVYIMSSLDEENHFRFLSLLINGGTLVERKLFDSKVPPCTLHSVLSTNRSTLDVLHRKKVINDTQRTLLSVKNTSSSDFDLSLLTCLLRNICGLAKSDDKVWISSPSANDMSIEADITRLKEHRNKVKLISIIKKYQNSLTKHSCIMWKKFVWIELT